MDTNILLIGPMRAGKTTVGRLLAEHLQLPQVSVDKVRREYYAELNYDGEYAQKLWQEGGFKTAYPYWKPFEIHAVERVLQDHPARTVIDFGAGHSVYEDPAFFDRAQKAFAAYPYVFLLIPCDDHDESIRILHRRDLEDGESGLPELNHHFVKHESNRRLAKYVIYTRDKTPEQTRDEILSLIQ